MTKVWIFMLQIISFIQSDRITTPGGKGTVWYASPKTVNNYTIKYEMKRNKNG